MSLSFRTLKYLSFTHSTIYLALLACMVLELDGPKLYLGWAHGLGWIAMCVLCLAALRARVIDLPLAMAVTVLGGVGPFVGSAAFLWKERGRTDDSRVAGTVPVNAKRVPRL